LSQPNCLLHPFRSSHHAPGTQDPRPARSEPSLAPPRPAAAVPIARRWSNSGSSAWSAVTRRACLNAGLGLGALAAAAVASVTRRATFTAVYQAGAASFLAFVPVLARLPRAARRQPAATHQRAAPASQLPALQPHRAGFRELPRDTAPVRAWALTAVASACCPPPFQRSSMTSPHPARPALQRARHPGLHHQLPAWPGNGGAASGAGWGACLSPCSPPSARRCRPDLPM